MSIMTNRSIDNKIMAVLRGKESAPTIIIGQEALRIYENLNNSETRHLAVLGLHPKVYRRARSMGTKRRAATTSGLKLPMFVTCEEYIYDIEREEREVTSKLNDIAIKKANNPEFERERLANKERLDTFLWSVT